MSYTFFTDSKLINQKDKNAINYGDLGAPLKLRHIPYLRAYKGLNEFSINLSSIHFADTAAAPRAFAVCEGNIIIRHIPQSNGTDNVNNNLFTSRLVDIILKPRFQSPYHPNVKYFIYKGVRWNKVPALIRNSNCVMKFYDATYKIDSGSQEENRWLNHNNNASVSNNLLWQEISTSTNTRLVTNGPVALQDTFGNLANDDSFLDDLFATFYSCNFSKSLRSNLKLSS